MPTHGIYRPSSISHPVRIVMNASYKPKSVFGVQNPLSLNDCLLQGSNLLPHVSDLVTKFRFGKHPITGDIHKAFFNIGIRSEDRQYLRLIYETPKRMCRVPFGVKCSPYLLQATIIHHLNICLENRDITMEEYLKFRESLYMDDLTASFHSESHWTISQHCLHSFFRRLT